MVWYPTIGAKNSVAAALAASNSLQPRNTAFKLKIPAVAVIGYKVSLEQQSVGVI
jgi:hypothetical protein